MTLFRYSILAVTFAAALGAAGAANAADKDERTDPMARHCTNDPDLASDTYEYLQDCPAAAGLLNRTGQWEAGERGAMTTPGARGNMDTPSTAGQGSIMGRPSAPGGSSTGTPSAPGGSSMGTPSAPSGGKAN